MQKKMLIYRRHYFLVLTKNFEHLLKLVVNRE